ncbi:MAG: acyl-CoA desaturase [Myxococcales bacterium]|jgi:stearoyl-CoA desaturase (delta-9 desaturase)|nr:acyl-CoA desaturase [Myxococcales bacterium]
MEKAAQAAAKPDTLPDDGNVDRKIPLLGVLPFVAIHVATVACVAATGWSWKGFALAMGFYFLRMFGVTGVYHRYFAHRTYKTSRWFQLVLALLAMTSFQKGVLWWASHHRLHHKMSDKQGDPHSMKRDGFWWSHVGWIMCRGYDVTDMKRVGDLAKFPELVFLNKFYWLPPLAWAIASYAIGGTHALIWATGVSTVLLWHGTFTINSISHWAGKARYKTGDESKNSWILAIVTMGEGWHNNHHYYQRATNQGFFWWEIDVTFYILKVLSWVGLVWDLHVPPKHVLESNLVAGDGKHGEAKGDAVPALAAPVTSDAE